MVLGIYLYLYLYLYNLQWIPLYKGIPPGLRHLKRGEPDAREACNGDFGSNEQKIQNTYKKCLFKKKRKLI